ncbi:MAG: hypothetical protein F4X16_17790 [Caldilineaceae bacterium SB0661_bin_34]|nr:hypothetical protein [Caldilineaceae bacterium SB0661_bin_34]
MKRKYKLLWDIVPPKVRDRTEALWPDAEAVRAYLRTRAQSTLDSRDAITAVAADDAETRAWADPRREADTDLARVYGFAARHAGRFRTYAAFRENLNRIHVGQLAAQLEAEEGWSDADMDRAGSLLSAGHRTGETP